MKSSLFTTLFTMAIAFASAAAAAHGDEDHGSPPGGAVTGDPSTHGTAAAGSLDAALARREADGSLFVPKAVQYQLGLRTRLAKTEVLATTLVLAGKVVADPNAGGRVQASQTGRVEPGPQGLPVLGQRVTKGQVLAWLQPTIGNVERGNQQAQLATLNAQLTIAKGKVARYEQLEGVVPRKDIEAARIELQSLETSRAAVGAGLSGREQLRAPVSGVVSATAAVAGQVVESREILFEIVDPARLAIEALAYDPALANGVEGASAIVPGGTIALQFVGAGRQLRAQALPLLFRVRTPNAALAIGQPLQVIARTSLTTQGVAVPQQALVRNRAGDVVVWVHNAAEQFTPRRVVSQPLDAQNLVVTSGISPGERIVIAGASLLAQVR